MATIDDKALIDKIIANNGYYYDDPRVVKIVEYTNAFGGHSYGITYFGSQDRYAETEYVKSPKLIWEAK